MATDIQARDTGNSAMIIALVAVILLGIGAFAYFGSGGTRVIETPGPSSTTVITQPAAPAAPDVHIDVPAPVIVHDGASTAPSGSGSAAPSSDGAASSSSTSGSKP